MNWQTRAWLPPLLALLAGLIFWQCLVSFFDLPRFLLPAPFAVAQVIEHQWAELLSATGRTAGAAMIALFLSGFAGTLIGLIFAQSSWIRRALFPYAVFLQTVPIVAIAPLITLWLGFGQRAVITVAVIISIFPMITNATAGLMAIDPLHYDLFRLNRASRWQVLWKLRLPTALPHLLTGARTCAGLAVLGAIVGEFFAGYGVTDYGLGYLIRYRADQSRTADLFAAVLAATLLGVIIFAIVSTAGAFILARWYDLVAEPTSRP